MTATHPVILATLAATLMAGAPSIQAKPKTTTDALDCVGRYAKSGNCDWNHWSELWDACSVASFPALNDDDFLLNKVKSGLCTSTAWPDLELLVNYREQPPANLDESVNCVSRYAHMNICDWDHWSEMAKTCNTIYTELAKDDFLLNKVKGGECTWDNWSNLFNEIYVPLPH